MITQSSNAWLLYFTNDPYLALSALYEDDLSSTYQWDDTVPNHANLKEGDFIALWNGKNSILRGASVVTRVIEGHGGKVRYRCPKCGKSKVMARKTISPRYRCGICGDSFETPSKEKIDIKTYRTDHSAGWVDLSHLEMGNEFKNICVSPKSQHSLRPLKYELFQEFLKNNSLGKSFNFIGEVRKAIMGGHKLVSVKSRIGQGLFRKKLIDLYGINCAVSGPGPKETIHACHLYSYSKRGRHEDGGNTAAVGFTCSF